MIPRPDPSEHHEYYSTYIRQVPDGDIIDTLRHGIADTQALLRGVPEAQAGYRYAPGKWSIKQVIAHLADSERTFAFRAFWFARGGPGDLASFDQDPFVVESGADERTLDDLLDEFAAVRSASVALYASLRPSVLGRSGIASGVRFSVRSFPFITAGHEIHHRAMLRERYLRFIVEG